MAGITLPKHINWPPPEDVEKVHYFACTWRVYAFEVSHEMSKGMSALETRLYIGLLVTSLFLQLSFSRHLPRHNLDCIVMRSSRCAFSTAAALHRVFVAPIEHSRVLPTCQFPATRAPKLHHASIRRISSASLPVAKRRLPRDEEIQDYMVRIVSDDHKLSPPQYTSSILNSIDRKNKTLVMVAMSDSDPDSNLDGLSYPICKIQSKKALREAEKARQKKKELPSATVKTIELNWAIDPHDLHHRLQRVKEFLSKGWRVDVVMAGRKKGRKATPEEAKILVGNIREAMKEVEGSKEWREMEGSLGAAATIFLVGKLAEKE
jgi:translation initiation factor IF-3